MSIVINHREVLVELAILARQAYRQLAVTDTNAKNQAILDAAKLLRRHQKELLAANALDTQRAQAAGVKGSFLDRLALDAQRIEGMAVGLESIAALPDPVGRSLAHWTRPNGLAIERVAVPLGVIAVIYEARPNVTADAGALCLKSGNAVLLRAGSDSIESSSFIAKLLSQALVDNDLPPAAITLLPHQEREAVGALLGLHGYIDVVIPRGGRSLIERVVQDSKIPTFEHLDGNCHTYVHQQANLDKAIEIIFNAKLRRTGVCGATESLLIDRTLAKDWLKKLVEAMPECEFRGDEVCCQAVPNMAAAQETDWSSEYLAPILSVKTVTGIEEAVDHINYYGSHHTDAIVTENPEAAQFFLDRVDSAIVLVNASTQFADGGEFGMGAEIGIATGRLHARGPVGVEQLTTYKYQVRGNGQTRP